jgi:dTDP-4-dehydrorhamnose 3,5-epimerase
MSSPVKLIRTRRFEDSRGWFVETWNQSRWSAQGVAENFVQDNHSLSRPVGTLRGIHFQVPPVAQGKLVRCVRGRIRDYAVDLRNGSPTYGEHVSAELSSDNGDQLWIPIGFGHGFVTLEPDTEVMYKVTAPYNAEAERGIRWDAPELAIDWPLPPGGPALSVKDEVLGGLAAFTSPFVYDGAPLRPL